MNAQYLHPKKRTDVKSTIAISNLCLQVSSCLKNVIQNVFTLSQGESVEELCVIVRAQWKKYQCENILLELEYFQNSKYVTETVLKPIQNNYWRAAFEAFGIENPKFETTKFKSINGYWKAIGRMTENGGELKYPQFFELVKSVLSISHVNNAPKRGLSGNKYLLPVHGTSTSNDAITALRLVRDHLIKIGGYMKLSINTNLILSTKIAGQKYRQNLEAKKLFREKEVLHLKLAEEMRENNESVREKPSKIESDSKIKKSGISVVKESIQEGNEKLQSQLKQSKFSRNEIQRAQSMIDMGLHLKRCLSIELEDLKKEKTKLLKKQ